MSDNATKPNGGPFTIWTMPDTAAEQAALISYPAAAPFTVWTQPEPVDEGSATASALISYPAAAPFTVWAGRKAEKIKVPTNRAFTVWAGDAPQPKPAPAADTEVESESKPAAAESESEAAKAPPATIASIFAEDDDDGEEKAQPLGKTMLKWLAIPLVLLLGIIGFYQLDTEVKELTEDKTTLIGEKNELTGALDGAKEENEKLTEKNRSLDKQLTQTQIANKSLEQQTQDLKKEIGGLKGDVAKLKSDMADAITRHAEEAKMLNATIKEKTMDIELKTARIADLDKMLASRDETIKGQKETIAARDKEIAGLNTAVKTADGRIAELQAKTQMLSKELDTSLKKASDLTAMLTETNKQLEASMAETKASAVKLRSDLDAMKARADTLMQEKSNAEKIAEEMKQKAAAAVEAQKKAEAAAAEAQKKATSDDTPVPASVQASAAPAEAGTKAIFNGRDLTGWEGDPRLWSVVDGAIVGETNDGDKKIGANSFLIWKGGEPGDFELSLKAKVTGNNNSGVQYRSKVIDAAKWVVGGYQMDMHPKPEYFGMLYEEKGRGIVAQRGQKVNVTPEGEKKVTGEVDKSKELDITQWNEYKIIAKGNKITHYVNGDVAMELVDDQESARSMKGVLAFQVHAGPAMKVEIKDVTLKQ